VTSWHVHGGKTELNGLFLVAIRDARFEFPRIELRFNLVWLQILIGVAPRRLLPLPGFVTQLPH